MTKHAFAHFAFRQFGLCAKGISVFTETSEMIWKKEERNLQISSDVYSNTPDLITSSGNYARRFSGATGRWFLDVQAEIILRMLNRNSDRVLLDVGGGHGQIARVVCADGYRVTVLGSSDKCFAGIRDLRSDLCTPVAGTFEQFPFPDDSFDAAIATRLLTHTAGWPKLLSEMCRVSRTMVIVDYAPTRSANFLYPFLFRAKRWLEGGTRRYRLLTETDLAEELAQNGYTIQGTEREFLIPMVVHRVIKCKTLSSRVESFVKKYGLTDLIGSPAILSAVRQTLPSIISTCGGSDKAASQARRTG